MRKFIVAAMAAAALAMAGWIGWDRPNPSLDSVPAGTFVACGVAPSVVHPNSVC